MFPSTGAMQEAWVTSEADTCVLGEHPGLVLSQRGTVVLLLIPQADLIYPGGLCLEQGWAAENHASSKGSPTLRFPGPL